MGDALSQSTVSFLQLLRQQEQAGDLSYASPEQARGESLDERSLVFSVGVLLFEELTGRHPFGAMASGRRFARIQKCELGSGVQFFPQVPAQLRNVLMKAMGPFPEERYRSLKELREHLERFVEGRADETPGKAVRRPLRGADAVAGRSGVHARRGIGADARACVVPRRRRRAALPVKVGPVRAVSVMHGPPVADSAVSNSTDKVASLRAVAAHLRHPRARRRGSRAARWSRSSSPTSRSSRRRRPRRRRRRRRGAAQPVATPLAPARNVEPPSLVSDSAEPTTFDADLGGRNAAKAARDCFTARASGAHHQLRRGPPVRQGRGALAPHLPVARRAAVSRTSAAASTTRSSVCRPARAPTHNTIVEYRFRLRPDGSNEVKATIQK